jgi:hypothetical protein
MAKTFSQTKGGGGASIGGPITGGTAKSVLFVNPDGIIAQDNLNFNYDFTNKQLGIGNTTGFSATTNTPLSIGGNINNYNQVYLQNASTGNNASSDFVLGADNDGVGATGHFGDFGIVNTGNTNAAFTMFSPNDVYLYASGGNLDIGTDGGLAGKVINFFTGGTLTANKRMILADNSLKVFSTITATGVLSGTSTTENYLNIKTVFPSVTTVSIRGVVFDFTTAGSSAFSQQGMRVSLGSGYTGVKSTIGFQGINGAQGTGIAGWTGGDANYGVQFSAFQTANLTAGHRVGGHLIAAGSSSLNAGTINNAINATNTPTLNLGSGSLALNGTVNVGGFFGLMATAPTLGTSAAIIGDNGATGSAVFLGRVNGTTVVSIDGTGIFSSTIATITPKIYPASDSTTAIQILKADGTTSIATIDTTNGRVGIGVIPTVAFQVNGAQTIISQTTNASSEASNATLVVHAFNPSVGDDILCVGSNGAGRQFVIRDQTFTSFAYGISAGTVYMGRDFAPSTLSYTGDTGRNWDINTMTWAGDGTPFIWKNSLTAFNTNTEQMRLDTSGRLGLGVSSATAVLHLKAGTATANTAPLQFNSGTIETTARAGLHEYDGNHRITNVGLLRYALGGKLFSYFTNTSVGGAETDIYTSTTIANTLGTNGDSINADYGGNFVTLGTQSVQLKVYFAGIAIWDSTAIAVTTGTTSWRVQVKVTRVSSTVVRYSVSLNTTGASGFTYATVGELTGLTLSNTNIIKITGFSSDVGSGVGDIVGKLGAVSFEPY